MSGKNSRKNSSKKTAITARSEARVLSRDLRRVRAKFAGIGAAYFEDIDPVTKQSMPCFRFRADIGDEDLRNLPNPPFRFGLSLAGTRVTDAGVKKLKELKNLTSLDLAWTQVSDARLVELKGLKNLTELRLLGTRVTDAGLDKLAGMKLRHLSVSDAARTDLGSETLPGGD
jgi:Leucine-rich repeat (LRR) protein